MSEPVRNTIERYAALLSRSFAVLFVLVGAVVCMRPVAADTKEATPQATPATDGVLALFAHRQVVALGDAHGLAQEEAFYAALVADPRFARQVGNVVVEFGGAIAQDIIDRYVAGEDVPYEQLRRVWTDTAGAFSPGEPVPLGIVNFFATVRAANRHLPTAQRIKVWLGDPKVDWTQIHSFQDLRPFLSQRDAHLFGVLDEEILRKHKKALLIVGLGHLFGPASQGTLASQINAAYPNSLSIVAPWLGYVESECNFRLAARMSGWPVPALLAPVQGTWLVAQPPTPNCNFLPPERLERMKKMSSPGGPPAGAGPSAGGGGAPAGGVMLGSGPPPAGGVTLGGGPPPAGAVTLGGGAPGRKMPSPAEMIEAETDIMSGRKADAILYLGPPDTLTRSPFETSLYMDLEYFKQQDARARCCSPSGAGLDFEYLVRDNPPVPRKFDRSE
jgi:hypothetical protein